MKKLSKERIGELLIICETLVFSSFPVVISYASKQMSPVLLAALSCFSAAMPIFLYLFFTKRLKVLLNAEAFKYILGVTLFIVIIPSALIFTGSSKTSGINTSMLLQSELVFTFAIYALLGFEKITGAKIVGAIAVMTGAFLVVYNGSAAINVGDLLIIAGTFFYPLGNLCAKKALKLTTPSVILFWRNLIGGSILFAFSILFEKYNAAGLDFAYQNWFYIALNGILIYCVSKLFWYEGIKRIDISKAIVISLGMYPAISLLLTFIFLGEIPSVYQWAGFVVITLGIFRITKKDKLLGSGTGLSLL